MIISVSPIFQRPVDDAAEAALKRSTLVSISADGNVEMYIDFGCPAGLFVAFVNRGARQYVGMLVPGIEEISMLAEIAAKISA